MRFGVLPVSGKVGRNGIDLIHDPVQSGFNTIQPGINSVQSRFDPVQPSPQICFYPVDLVAQHLVPFNDDFELVLEIFRYYTGLMLDLTLEVLGYYTRLVLDLSLEVVGHYADMMLENLLNLFYFISVHNISRQVSLLRLICRELYHIYPDLTMYFKTSGSLAFVSLTPLPCSRSGR
jgi:hypothetical protein